ncbi:MAG: glycosyltransferase [Actinomycetes bacterium]
MSYVLDRISFIVPTKNSARTMESCLSSLRNQAYPDVEVIVVDNKSTDETLEISHKYADKVETKGPERSAQRNHGADVATGGIVVFIDSDMTLEPTIASDIAAAFAKDPSLGALIIPERSFGEGYFAQCRVLEKSLYVGNDDVEAARVFTRDAWDRIGGWNEELTAAEDWDLADRTHAAGVKVSRVPSYIWHDEGHIELRNTFNKKRYYGQWISAYLKSHGEVGTSKLRRTALFDQPGRLVRDPVHTAGMFVMKATEAAGLLAGMRDAKKAAASA